MKPVIKIGCSAVLSEEEDEAVHGRHIAQAVGLAVEQANQRAEFPFELELLVGDDQAKTESALSVAREFIEDPRLLGIVGTMNSHTSLATAPRFSQAKLAQISPAASNPALTRQGFDSFFRVVPHDLYQGREGAKYAVQVLGARRIAIIHDGGSFGEPLAAVFSQTSRELGAQIVISRRIQPGKLDYREAAAEVAAAKPDLIFFGVIEAEGRHLAAQLRQVGLVAPYFGTDGLKPSRFLATPEYDVDGPYHTSASTDVYLRPSAATFAQAYRDRYGELYSIYTAEAYDAANILIAACAAAIRPERSLVLEQVAQTKNFSGASGTITFDKYGDRLNPQISMYKVAGDALVFLGYTQETVGQVA
jgi:branched-chain amino acid transport system substrate-binding protein